MNLEQPDRNHHSRHCKLSELEAGSVLFTSRSSASGTMTGACSVLNKGVSDLPDQLSSDLNNSTEKKHIIPRNIYGRIWNSCIFVISYL